MNRADIFSFIRLLFGGWTFCLYSRVILRPPWRYIQPHIYPGSHCILQSLPFIVWVIEWTFCLYSRVILRPPWRYIQPHIYPGSHCILQSLPFIVWVIEWTFCLYSRVIRRPFWIYMHPHSYPEWRWKPQFHCQNDYYNPPHDGFVM
jgi:hypothetical protein